MSGYARPAVGFSSETILVDIRRVDAGGSREERLVLKLPPQGLRDLSDLRLRIQARLQETVAARGMPAPVPVLVEEDTRWVGAPFLVMPAIDGHIIDELPIRDHWLTKVEPDLNTTVHGNYIDVIADINRIDWRAGAARRCRTHARQLDGARATGASTCGGMRDGVTLVPALVEALDWCEAHRPSSEPEPSLLWGDVRLGNVIFDEDRAPVAVLDWEMATIGAAEHDLAWTLTLESIQAELFTADDPRLLRPRHRGGALRDSPGPAGAGPRLV